MEELSKDCSNKRFWLIQKQFEMIATRNYLIDKIFVSGKFTLNNLSFEYRENIAFFKLTFFS